MERVATHLDGGGHLTTVYYGLTDPKRFVII